MEILKVRRLLKYLKGFRVVLNVRIENRKAIFKSNYNKFDKVILYQNIKHLELRNSEKWTKNQMQVD